MNWGLVRPEHADLNVILCLVSFDMVSKDNCEDCVKLGKALVNYTRIIP
jgi:hypothetical protein